MLDLETLRVVQMAVAVCAFALVFLGTFGATRAPFAGWWSAALAASGLTGVFIVMGEAHATTTSAVLSNATSVLGAFFTWMAARSLRQRILPWWVPVAVFGAVAVGTVVERPAGAAWPGGAVLLVGMSLFVGLAAMELWALRLRPLQPAGRRASDGERAAAVVSMAVASTVTSVFYAARVVVFVVAGPSSWFYKTWAGPAMTTFLMTLVLVVVTYSVTSLSHDRLARHWEQRAMNDDLTGLLTRTEFGQRARRVLREASRVMSPAVVVADLDHFKSINDRFGHAAGDKALVLFADAVRQVLGSDDIAARFGGEEFVFLIADANRHRVVEIVRDIDTAFASAGTDHRVRPTVSYGVALWDRQSPLDELIATADRALYEAKGRGRAQTVVAEVPATI